MNMRSTVVNTLVLAFALAGVSIALGQQTGGPPRKPRVEDEDVPKAKTKEKTKENTQAGQSQLEQMLAQALKNNPDIRVASAKASMAEAELNRARLQVTQEVIRLHHALLSQRATVAYQTKKYERIKQLQAQNAVSSEIVDEAQEAVTAAKAKLAELEAQMNALVGKSPREANADANAVRQQAVEALNRWQYGIEISTAEAMFRHVLEQHKPAGPIAERIRAALEKHITLKVEGEFVSEVLQHLEKQALLTIKLMAEGLPEPKLKLELTDLPLVAVLQYIEDSEPGYRFVVREYGLLFAPEAKLPPGAVRVQEFLRPPPARSEKPPEDKRGAVEKWPPPGVEGQVIRVDADLVQIDLGVKDGVHSGDTLDVYRLDPKPTYLGKLVIIDSKARGGIGKPQGRLASPVKLGDRVISHNSRPLIQFSSKAEEK
jgi:hypothetical protein